MKKLARDSFSNYRQSYRQGTKSHNTLGERIEKLVRIAPDGLACTQGARRLTWRQLDECVNKLANALLDLGIKKEERVGIAGFNSIEWLVADIALAKIGAVSFFLNPRFTLSELSYIVEDADAVAVIVQDEYAHTIKRVTEGLRHFRRFIVYGVGRRPQNIPEGAVVYDDLMERYSPAKPLLDYAVTNEDFSHLEYTIGSGGYPVGAVWDHERQTKGAMLVVFSSYLPVPDRGREKSALNLDNTILPIPGFTTLTHPFRNLTSWKKFHLWSIKQVLGTAFFIRLCRHFRKGELKALLASPLFFELSYNQVMGNVMGHGVSLVFLETPYPFNAAEFWRTVEREKVNMALIAGDTFAVPMAEELRQAKKEGREYDLSSLATIISSGVRWTPRAKKDLLQFIPHLIMIDGYGARGSGVSFVATDSAGDKEITSFQAKVDRKGVYSFQAPCKVVNPDTGKEVKPGSQEIGEFLTGGYSTAGFWKNPGETKQAFREWGRRKYFFAGDMGYVDEKGWFHPVGRMGIEVIKRGGENVYAEEVEDVLKAHPKVEDAAVVGISAAEGGEIVVAIVALKSGVEFSSEELIKHCQDNLPEYKVPEQVIFVESIPRLSSGKMDRRMLKEFAQGRSEDRHTGLTRYFT